MKKNIPYYFVLMIGLFACQSKSANTAQETTETIQHKTAPFCGSIATLAGVDKLPLATLRPGIGNSHLTITTKNADAQRWFDQGLNHLHGFWHLEAYRAFKQVIKLDSTCAMGYWGLSMCQPGFGGTEPIWIESINKAASLKGNSSAIEKSLIEATDVLIKKGIAEAQTPFRNLYKTYPNEPEAIAFAAIMLRQHENETTQQEVKKLLENALIKFPNNMAIMHYYIHVMELRPEFAQAKSIAAKMNKIAPNAPHLTHMPGHLYYLAGQYDKAISVYKTALKQETDYHTSNKIPFISNQNYIHNLQFLAVSQAETNNYQAALATATQLANISLQSEITNNGAIQMFTYEGRILPALVHIRYNKWQKAIEYFDNLLNSLDNPINNNSVKIYFQVMRLYCQAMFAITNKQTDQATMYGGQLSQLMQQFEQEGMNKQNTPEFKSINETYDIMSMARYELAGWIDNIDSNKPFNDAAWKEAISLQNAIKYDEPPRLMYPIEESLGKLYLYRKNKQKAKEFFQKALQKRPHSQTILAEMK
jgi:tetratricopeptide (TPR) repeat protein